MRRPHKGVSPRIVVAREPGAPYSETMLWFIAFLLIVWLAVVITGFIVKGLLWLAVFGLVMFALTSVWLYLANRD